MVHYGKLYYKYFYYVRNYTSFHCRTQFLSEKFTIALKCEVNEKLEQYSFVKKKKRFVDGHLSALSV